MLNEIFRFEIRYHFKQLVFYVAFVLFFLLTFGAVTSDSVTIGGSIGNVHRNAPFVIMQFLLVMSVFAVFTTTAFVSNSALRDFDLGTDALFFSSPIRKSDYLIGRFSGAVVVSFLIYLGVVGGIMLGSFMPWLEKERIGAFTLTPYVFSMFVLIAPTVLLVAAIFFCTAALTRSVTATYAGAVTFLVGYLIASAVAGNNRKYERFASLFDPFGITPFELATRYWTVAERNTRVLPLEGVFLWNRLLWLAIALGIFAFTLWRFRFDAASRRSSKKKLKAATEEAPVRNVPPAMPPVVAQDHAWFPQFRTTWKMELVSVLKSIPFLIILVLALVNTIGGAAFADSLFDTTIYPVTGVMLQTIDGSFLFFALIIITFYAGEIVFRERQQKLNEVADAMPVPTSAIWGGKLAALYSLVVLLLFAAMVATVSVQAAKGYTNFDFALYGKGLFLQTMLPMLMTATLAFVLQVVTNNKYVGFLMMVLYVVSLAVLPAMHFEHNLYRFGNTPDAPYSDMNGFGHFVQPLFWFNLYWSIFCGLIVLAAHLLWVRGTESAWRIRTRIGGSRFTFPARMTFALLLIAFTATGGYIYYNTNVLNHYRTQDELEKRAADYEKKFSRYANAPLPKITDAQADVDLYPERRALSIRGSYVLQNRTGAPLRDLYVTMSPEATRYSVSIPTAKMKTTDETQRFTIYTLDPPLAPNATLTMRYTVDHESRGFQNARSNTDVIANGTFINNFSYFPHLGYQGGNELQDANKRRKYGLPPVQRLPKINDPVARNINQLTAESDWMNLDTTVSTSADQIAIAPGYLQKEWTANGRRYFRYKTTSPILGFWSYLSARYAVKRDTWRDVAIEVYYDPQHPYNVDRMIDGVKKSLDYFSANFSPYQHKQVRILEFPRYARFAQSFPNTIPFSESIGFIADLRDPSDIDYVFYVTAHEVAHQWWAHQVVGARVQGTTMITETMAQYSALMVMEKQYGRNKMQKFLRHELNRYLRGRGGELVAEMPLMLVEDQTYIHYGKGSLVMYALRDFIGEDNVNAGLRDIIGQWAFHGPPYVLSSEMVARFRAHAPADRQSTITDLFEKIVLFDNKATEATATKMADGKYKVRFTVESKKFLADGGGNETSIPVDEWIDVGVLAKGIKDEDRVLALEKKHLTQPRATFEMIVSEKPSKAGIDPLNKLIDRNPEDNTKDM